MIKQDEDLSGFCILISIYLAEGLLEDSLNYIEFDVKRVD